MSVVKVNPSSLPTKLAPFTGVNNGTSRLLKAISAFELASLREGDIVYVESVIGYWKWLPASTETDNTTTEVTVCAPTVVGVGAGRFDRLLNWASPEVMLQTEWHIASTGNNENTGLAGFPLLTTDERRRRMGNSPLWRDNTAYHIRYLSDNFSDVIDGYRGTNTTIYCHGSVNDFEGASTLYSGSVTSITALNIATGQPYVVNSAGLAVNWAGLIDARIRVTSGANVKALSSAFFQDTGTAKSAWCDEFLTPAASLSVAPFVAPGTAQAPPVAGDTFVVETLRIVTRLQNNLINTPNSSNTSTGLVLDSIQCPTLLGSPSSATYVYGCKPGTPFTQVPVFYNFRACIFANLSLVDTGLKNITGGHVVGSLILINNFPSNSGSIQNFTLQGSSFLFFGGSGSGSSPDSWRPGQLGMHNHVNPPLEVNGPGVRMGGNWAPYGIGNSAPLWGCAAGFVGIAQAGSWTACAGYQTTATSILQMLIGPKNSAPAFDPTTGIYTAPRFMTAANLEATILAGGFNYLVIDPQSGAGFIKY